MFVCSIVRSFVYSLPLSFPLLSLSRSPFSLSLSLSLSLTHTQIHTYTQLYSGWAIYYKYYGGKHFKIGECGNVEANLFAGFIMYLSYLVLFVKFAVDRFIFGVNEEGEAIKKSSKEDKKSK